MVRWEIQTFGGQTAVLPGSSIHQPRGLGQVNLSEPASASEPRSYLTPSRYGVARWAAVWALPRATQALSPKPGLCGCGEQASAFLPIKTLAFL